MNKPLKVVISGIISAVICYFAYSIYSSYKNSYNVDMYNYKPYFWIFKDSAKSNVDTNIFVSCTRKTDVFNHYCYNRSFFVSIWDFKDISTFEINKTAINQNVNLNGVQFSSGEILNKNSSPEIKVSFDPFFKYAMDINLDENSNIERIFETDSYKGFYGQVNKLSLTDENKNHLILFDFKVNVFCLAMVYKTKTGFYFIMIYSKKQFDESIINILNLN